MGAAAGCGLGDGDDVRDVGRELDDDRQGDGLPHATGDLLGELRALAEVQAALHVGAADVDLERGDAGRALRRGRERGELVDALAGDAQDDGRAPFGPSGRVVAEDGIDAGVLEPDGVQEPAGTVGGAGLGVPLPGVRRGGLGDDRAQTLEVHAGGKPCAIAVTAKDAGSDHDGVAQQQAVRMAGRNLDVQVRLRHGWTPSGGHSFTAAWGGARLHGHGVAAPVEHPVRGEGKR